MGYDKPFLQPNETLAFLIEWGGLILFLALVLAPFFVLLLKKFRPTRWHHIVLAYLSSFGILSCLIFIISTIDTWFLNNFVNTAWLNDPLDNIIFRSTLPLLSSWPLAIFYSTKLLYKKFTKKRFFISLGLSILFFITLVVILAYVVVVGLGHIGRTYF